MKIFRQQKWLVISLSTIIVLVFCILFLIKFPKHKISTIEINLHRELAYQWAYQKINDIREMDFVDISLGTWKPEKKKKEKMPVYLVVKVREIERNLKRINVEVAWKETEMNVIIKVNTLVSKYK